VSARLLTIFGRVQGVGYRDWLVAQAGRLGVHGWVRNRRDGTVEALLHGDGAAVAVLVALCREGPPHADVTDIAERPAEPPQWTEFRRWPTA
jgi:acylphosphatase